MSSKILLVDDDANVLAGYQRHLRKQFVIEIATSGADGLQRIANVGPFAVVVSDMQMPRMSGIEFLAQVRALAPQTVRMMLTGNADQKTATAAVNEGHIFRFLTKPCPMDTFAQALEASLTQYRMVIAEAELLDKTLIGCVSVMVEILGIVDPIAFNHARNLRNLVRDVATALNFTDKWQLELAALLSPLGRMTLPSELTIKSHNGQALTQIEQEVLARVPEISHDLIAKIPRLGPVAKNVLYHTKPFQGSGFPNNGVTGEEIPFGARLLKILSDLLEIETNQTPRYLAFRLLQMRKGWYDPNLFSAINARFNSLPVSVPKTRSASVQERMAQVDADGSATAKEETINWIDIPSEELVEDDVLITPVYTLDGFLLLAAGSVITRDNLTKLRHLSEHKGILEPIRVLITAA